MKRHQESHLDHGLSPGQIEYIFKLFEGRSAFFIETIELPQGIGQIPCGLWGPIMGDTPFLDSPSGSISLPPGEYIAPIKLSPHSPGALPTKLAHQMPVYTGEITFAPRPPRTWNSRLIDLPMRPTRTVTVIAGPHEEHDCILYTAYGGPCAPQEPTDPKISPAKLDEAIKFWDVHALSKYAS